MAGQPAWVPTVAQQVIEAGGGGQADSSRVTVTVSDSWYRPPREGGGHKSWGWGPGGLTA